MRNRRARNAPPTTPLVEYFIGTAYDAMKAVSDALPWLQDIWTNIDDGTLGDYVTEVEMDAAIDAAVDGLYDHKGGYDATTNTPDLDVAPTGIEKGDAYTCTVAGNFFTAYLEAGDVIIADVDNANQESNWTIVNKNIDSSAFATAAQGVLADSALQATSIDTLAELNAILTDANVGDIANLATSGQGAKADTALQPGGVHNVSELINDANYSTDTLPAQVSAGEKTAGTETALRSVSPKDIADMAGTHGGGGGGGGGLTVVFKSAAYTANAGEIVYVDSSGGAVTITLPASPSGDDQVVVVDVGGAAGSNNITVARNGETVGGVAQDFIIDQDYGQCDFAYDGTGTDWSIAPVGFATLDSLDPFPHKYPGINAQTGTGYTHVEADEGYLITMDNAAANTFTIDSNANVPHAVGTRMDIMQIGVGQTSIAIVSDTLQGNVKISDQWQVVTVIKIAATTWVVVGGTV